MEFLEFFQWPHCRGRMPDVLFFGPMMLMTNSMTLALASCGACFQGNNRSSDVLGRLLCHVMRIWDRLKRLSYEKVA